jgi:hypothetical protein
MVDEATGREAPREETVLGQDNCGMENDKEIFQTTQDPYGQIEGWGERGV